MQEILHALRLAGGTIYFKKPLTLWVDEIFGEIPVTVKKITTDAEPNATEGSIRIGDDYTDIHLETNEIKRIAYELKR